MSESHDNQNPSWREAGRGTFATTHWSVVLAAKDASSGEAHVALEKLCQNYWYPIYAFVRRQGRDPEDAKDLTQEFFTRLLANDFLSSVEPRKGKFRTFLLAALNNFLAKEWNRAHRLKRGGGVPHVSLEAEEAETRYRLEPSDVLTPEKIFDRRWAMTVLDQAMDHMQEECAARGKDQWFEALKSVLTGDRDAPYSEIASKLGMSEGAVKVAVHRLRERYAALLRAEISNTVSHPDEVDDEIRSLFAAIG